MMRRLTHLGLFVLLFVFPWNALAAPEPPVIVALLDAIAAKVGVRPTYARISEPDRGAVVIEGFNLSIRDPVEPNNHDDTTIQRISFEGLREVGDGFDIDAVEVTGGHHNLSIFSMEVLQIGSLFIELGVDPPGSLGMAVDETIEIGHANGEDIRFRAAAFAKDGVGSIGFREVRADLVTYSADAGVPLAIHDIAVEERRKRSAGQTRSYHVGRTDMTAPWLEKIAGNLFAELGYGALAVSLDAETFRLNDHARASLDIDAEGAFRITAAVEFEDTAALAPSVDAILATSPRAAFDLAEFVFLERGMTKRAMALLGRQTGAQPQAIAAALAQQAGSALRRAGYRRVAAETVAALTQFLAKPIALQATLPGGPLAALAGMNGTNTPTKLEAAGLTIAARP